MELLKRARESEAQVDLNELIAEIPYARFLGVTADLKGNELTTILNFDSKLIGNPVLPALHGGVIGAFLELTAIIQMAAEVQSDTLPKPVDVTIDYLRSGKPVDTYGRAVITKQGRRVANVRAEAWQEDRSRPIAAFHGHFLVKPADEEANG